MRRPSQQRGAVTMGPHLTLTLVQNFGNAPLGARRRAGGGLEQSPRVRHSFTETGSWRSEEVGLDGAFPRGQRATMSTTPVKKPRRNYQKGRRAQTLKSIKSIQPCVAIPHPASVDCVAATDNMRWVFTGGADGLIRKFDFFGSLNSRQSVLLNQWCVSKSTTKLPSPVCSLVCETEGMWAISGKKVRLGCLPAGVCLWVRECLVRCVCVCVRVHTE